MRFNIISSNYERLRLRVGKYVFTKKQGYYISTLLFSIEGVFDVITNPANGGILVQYSNKINNNCYNEILNTINKINVNELEESEPNNQQSVNELQTDFKDKVVYITTKHFAIKLLTSTIIPSFIGNIRTCICALKYIKEGISSLISGKLTVEVLDATAITTSILTQKYSTASSVMYLLTLSDILLNYSNLRAKNALANSLSINIDTVWQVLDDCEIQIPLTKLQIADNIKIRMGSLVPIDGVVVSGDASINESMLTGESLPVHKRAGSTVYAGTVVAEGELIVKVTHLTSSSRIANIVKLIDEGEDNKASIQGKAERLADNIVPVSFGLFFLTWLLTRDIPKALSVLMVDFSCAIKLTTPIVILSALRLATNEQILVKGGKYLEILSHVDTVVFDKTGTLTNATSTVSNVITVSDEYSKDDVLKISACLEEHFPHSVANAIVKHAQDKGLNHPEDHEKVEYVVAHGIASSYQGKRAIIGSYHFIFEDENVEFPEDKKDYIFSEIDTNSAIYLAIDQKLVGIICINDPPRDDAKQLISALKSRKNSIKNIIMLTGDSESNAKYVCKELGIDKYHATVLPEQKAEIITKLKEEGKTVLMVGDGINDTPALSVANVSITLNDSSDLAREVADIAIHSDELLKIVTAFDIADMLMTKIQNNYRFIVLFNSTLIIQGILGIVGANTTAFLHNTSTFLLAGTSATLPNKQLKNNNLDKEENNNETS